jgi:hypothetical protein
MITTIWGSGDLMALKPNTTRGCSSNCLGKAYHMPCHWLVTKFAEQKECNRHIRESHTSIKKPSSALYTVASRLKILQNNSKPAVENDWLGKYASCMTTDFWHKRPEKKYFIENRFFPHIMLSF